MDDGCEARVGREKKEEKKDTTLPPLPAREEKEKKGEGILRSSHRKKKTACSTEGAFSEEKKGELFDYCLELDGGACGQQSPKGERGKKEEEKENHHSLHLLEGKKRKKKKDYFASHSEGRSGLAHIHRQEEEGRRRGKHLPALGEERGGGRLVSLQSSFPARMGRKKKAVRAARGRGRKGKRGGRFFFLSEKGKGKGGKEKEEVASASCIREKRCGRRATWNGGGGKGGEGGALPS